MDGFWPFFHQKNRPHPIHPIHRCHRPGHCSSEVLILGSAMRFSRKLRRAALEPLILSDRGELRDKNTNTGLLET